MEGGFLNDSIYPAMLGAYASQSIGVLRALKISTCARGKKGSRLMAYGVWLLPLLALGGVQVP